MSYLQNSIAPKWNIYVSFVTKSRLRFTRVSTRPSQIKGRQGKTGKDQTITP